MSVEISYSEARNNLASLLDRVTGDREVVVINRRGREKVAMISADELSSVLESLYLLRSPKNAERLMKAIKRAEAGTTKPSTIDELRKEFGVEKDERS
ncbi:MAG: type II toxin-antitoxin system prevent-host-death family antitoxin [Pyrinomonadaceae bacterium]|nr:type II toxin-antitoxin system prevent-host-death family antitoxin [Pyrinomonadaceae bacterium]